ncbi:hypothetical protein, partial [Castellaniella sp.]|uniref:phage tail tip fiber protein n=1 Tax=Castellaniella sp. TaxID=1955812 RepID=UPI003560A05A
GGLVYSGDGYGGGIDVVPPPAPDGLPPAPTGLQATSGLALVILQWDRTVFSYYGYAEIWRATENNLSNALLVGQTTSWIYSDVNVIPGVEYFYWVRYVSAGGKPGPFNKVAGTSGTVSFDPEYLINVLSADDPKALLMVVEEATTINGVSVQPGIYIRDLFVANGSISRLKIGLAAIDDARIANMSVDKLLAGSLQADQYIQSTSYVAGTSGFRLSANGNAELNNAVLRGTIYATAGLIGGNTITSTEVKSPTFSEGSAGWRLKSSGDVEFNNGTFRGALDAATGSFKGSLDAATGSFKGALDAATGSFKGTVDGGAFVVGDFTSATWPASGKSGAYLGPVGLRIGNYNDGKYFEVLQNGNVYAPGLSIVNGLMTISAIDVIDTLQIAGQAVTTAVSYSTDSSGGGSFSFYTSVSAYVYLFVRGRPVYQSVVPGSSSTTVMAAISGVMTATSQGFVTLVPPLGESDSMSAFHTYVPGFAMGQVSAGYSTVTTNGKADVLCLVLRR